MNDRCTWSLLTMGELKFIYTSNRNNEKVLGRSLFEVIHPDEVLLAKRDLDKFMNTDVLGGSITRCRLLDYTTNFTSWIVFDIIMYVATESVVLAFFHRPEPRQGQVRCGDMNETININKMKYELKRHDNATTRFNPPNQNFHILDNRNKSVQLSWPDHYPNEKFPVAQMAFFFNDRHEESCFHCVHQPETTTDSTKVNRLLIKFGNLSFVLSRYTTLNKDFYTKRSNLILSSSMSLPCSPTTNINHHYDNNRKFPSAPTSPISTRIKLKDLLLPSPPVLKQHFYENHAQQQAQRNHCLSCGTVQSPEWRRGPTGHKTLCNACGLRYSRSVARQEKMMLKQQQKQQMYQCSPAMRAAPYHLNHHHDRHYKASNHTAV